MTDWDLSGSEENTSEWSELLPSAESIIQGFKIPLEINRGVQKLIIDYTLGAAIIGLIPASLSGKMGLFVLGLINLKMVLDIWCCWGKPKEKRIQMIIVILFAFLGALATAFLARLIFSLFGLVIPLIIVLNGAVGHATLTWSFGRATNQFYLNSIQANSLTLKQLVKVHHKYGKRKNLRH